MLLNLSIQNSTDITTKFELKGSTPHYPPPLSFAIDYMVLIIEPDLKTKEGNLTNCTQKLDITAKQDNINEIELDIAEIRIHSVSSSANLCKDNKNSSNNKNNNNEKELFFITQSKKDKLTIRLAETLSEDDSICITIKYSAGIYGNDFTLGRKPRSGFHFIQPDKYYPEKNLQAWTQGETIESRYWFPCLDDPQVKFTREIHIMVPEDYIVISNGDLVSNNAVQVQEEGGNISNEKEDKNKTEWIWRQETPISTYLTSVVIGSFSHAEDKCGKLSLSYYWPKDIENKNYEPMLTFKSTPSIIEFFQKYLDTKYPYSKYSQVAVDDFDFGGMENASCTTLTRNFLHDKKASIDYTGDIGVLSHELAHQWFGDLVTCRDWSHIWLHEGFATYFEALYKEHDRGLDDNEFLYYLRQISNRYFNEATNEYKRPLVTNVYKHPDDVFDDHSYRKGACVLHMIRHYIGNNAFKKSLNAYLDKYRNKTAETDDLRQILELVSGKSLQPFFNQWVYKPGHPELEIEYALEEEKDSKKLKIKVTQKQEQQESNEFVFEFPLEVRIVFSNDNNDKKPETIQISEKVTEYSYNIPKHENIKWISIDPEFKILKQIKTLEITEEKNNFKLKEMLINQLKNAKTVIERIQAATVLQDKKYSDDYVIDVLKDIILSNTFYGVCVAAVNTLGSYASSKDENIKSKVYQTLSAFFRKDNEGKNQLYSALRPQIRQALVTALGGFEREESLDILKPLLSEQSYFIEQQAAIAIGRSSKNLPSDSQKKKEMIQLLKDLTNTTTTFQNVLARGAIDGLKEFSKDEDEQIVEEVADIIVNKSSYGNEYLVRGTATSALGKFLRNKDKKVNNKVFDQLKELLKDNRFNLQIDACISFVDSDAMVLKPDAKLLEAIEELTWVAEHDLDGWVRREAEVSVNKMKKWIKDWLDKPMDLILKIREEEKDLEEKAIQVRRNRTELY
jgi:aminopeptidase N